MYIYIYIYIYMYMYVCVCVYIYIGRGLARHNISRVSIYHEPGDDAPAAWSAVGRLARCRDSIYHESSSDKMDGVLDVTFTVPHRNMSGESSKELSLDLEVALRPRWPCLVRAHAHARAWHGGVFVRAR